MIQDWIVPDPKADDYDTVLAELDRQQRNLIHAETVLREVKARYEAAWYAVLRAEELNARGGN